MYLEFLFFRAHSRRRVERMYWSGLSLNSFTACSNEVTTGTTGPIGSGFPQFGFPRLLAIVMSSYLWIEKCVLKLKCWIPDSSLRFQFGTKYYRDRPATVSAANIAKTVHHKATSPRAQCKSPQSRQKTGRNHSGIAAALSHWPADYIHLSTCPRGIRPLSYPPPIATESL